VLGPQKEMGKRNMVFVYTKKFCFSTVYFMKCLEYNWLFLLVNKVVTDCRVRVDTGECLYLDLLSAALVLQYKVGDPCLIK
jgi:hypothetical protein